MENTKQNMLETVKVHLPLVVTEGNIDQALAIAQACIGKTNAETFSGVFQTDDEDELLICLPETLCLLSIKADLRPAFLRLTFVFRTDNRSLNALWTGQEWKRVEDKARQPIYPPMDFGPLLALAQQPPPSP